MKDGSSDDRNSGSGGGRVGAVSLGVTALRSRTVRRQIMFLVTLGLMALVFLGAVILDRALTRNGEWFLAYWCFVFAGAMFLMTLAAYDLLAVRREARRRERELQRQLVADMREAMRDAEADGDSVDGPRDERS